MGGATDSYFVRFRRLLVMAFVLLTFGPIQADTVRLKDGRVFEGRVITHRGLTVEIDCLVQGIRSTLSFRQAEVRRVEFADLPDGFFERKKDKRPARPKAPRVAQDKMRYTVVLLHGTFGEEIHADDVREVLSRARKTSDCIVLDVDSGGGFVAEAEAVVDVMEEFADRFVYVAVIRKGLSASIYPIFACDHILMQPGGTFGAAVAFTGDPATGSAEVDAKFNSAMAARVAALATSNGWDPAIARAMVVRSEKLVRWNDRGTLKLDAKAPANAIHPETIDGSDTVLTISADVASDIGFPRVLTAATGVKGIGPAFAPTVMWKRGSRYGHVVYEQAVEKWNDFRDGYASQESLKAAMEANIKDAYAADPDKQRYERKTISVYDQGRRRRVYERVPTEASWAKWYGSTDNAVGAWSRVATQVRRLGRLNDLAPYYHRPRKFDGLELRGDYDRAQREITRLKANRDRGPTT